MPPEQCTTSACKAKPGQPLICPLPGLCMKSWGSGCVLGASLFWVQEGTTREPPHLDTVGGFAHALWDSCCLAESCALGGTP